MLKGDKVILRPLKFADIEKISEWRNDLETIQLAQYPRFPKTIEMDKEWFDMLLADRSNKNIYFGIDEIESKMFIGISQLNNIDYVSGTAIWGLVIGSKEKRGMGLGIESLKLLIDYAFGVLNLRKLFGYPLEKNVSTMGLHKKLNVIKEEGRLKQHYYFDGEYHDVLILSLFKEDYLSDR